MIYSLTQEVIIEYAVKHIQKELTYWLGQNNESLTRRYESELDQLKSMLRDIVEEKKLPSI